MVKVNYWKLLFFTGKSKYFRDVLNGIYVALVEEYNLLILLDFPTFTVKLANFT